MRACYLVQTYRSPDQVLRLVRTLTRSSPGCQVVVSHDSAGSPLPTGELEASGAVRVSSAPGGWGDFNTVDRYLRAVRWLADAGVAFDWLINITGQDYPLRPLPEVEAGLAGSGADGFLEHFPVFTRASRWGRHEGRTRYLFRYRWLARDLSRGARAALRPGMALNYGQPLLRLTVSYGLAVGRRTRSPFGPAFRCYGGSFYCALSRRCVDYLVEFCRTQPEVVTHFRHTLVPEEAFFQTILVNSGRFRLRNDSQRYYDFRGSKHGSPKVLTTADLPALRASGKAFGRKFDQQVDASVLDALDEVVAGRAGEGAAAG